MNYERTHVRTLRRVQKRGAPIRFALEGASTHVATTETWAQTLNGVVDGYAVELRGDPEEYLQLELIEVNPVTLLFVPVTYNTAPGKGWVGVWAGKARTVRDSRPIRPAGEVVAVRMVLT